MSENQEPQKQFAIQKLYIKDASFESPSTPQSFVYKKWEPKIDLNLTNEHKQAEGDSYEVELRLTVTVSMEGQTLFLIEIHQAGLFTLAGFSDEERRYLLGSQCMNILFPYAREFISETSVRGGFPPLVLQPVNFDALYQQHLQRKKAEQESAETRTRVN